MSRKRQVQPEKPNHNYLLNSILWNDNEIPLKHKRIQHKKHLEMLVLQQKKFISSVLLDCQLRQPWVMSQIQPTPQSQETMISQNALRHE